MLSFLRFPASMCPCEWGLQECVLCYPLGGVQIHPLMYILWRELACRVHVIGLFGQGRGFCGGYDLVESAEGSFQDFSTTDAR